MKTLIIILFLLVIIFYSFRSLINHLKGKDKCCGEECLAKSKEGCSCHKEKVKK